MPKFAKKGTASVILALIGFVLLVDDLSGRWQKIEMIAPPAVRPILPLLYGALFLGVLILVRSQHKDEIDAMTQPDLAAVLQEQRRLRDAAIPRTLSDNQKECLRRRLAPGNCLPYPGVN